LTFPLESSWCGHQASREIGLHSNIWLYLSETAVNHFGKNVNMSEVQIKTLDKARNKNTDESCFCVLHLIDTNNLPFISWFGFRCYNAFWEVERRWRKPFVCVMIRKNATWDTIIH